MFLNNVDRKVLIAIYSSQKYDVDLLDRWFTESQVQSECEFDDECGKWVYLVDGITISNNRLNDLIKAVISIGQSFTIELEAIETYFNAKIDYQVGEDFVTITVVDGTNVETGEEFLIKHIFEDNDSKQVVISELDDLVIG